MNNDESSVKYLVDSSYYDQFSAEILGVYCFYDDIPLRIWNDLNTMAQILNRYIYLKGYKEEERKLSQLNHSENLKRFKKIVSIDVFTEFCNEYLDNHSDMRDINIILKNHTSFIEIQSLHDKLRTYINKKKEFYFKQNYNNGILFCREIEDIIIKPLDRLIRKTKISNLQKINLEERHINSLNKEELKLRWDKFKVNKLGLIQAYFNANLEKLKQLDANNTFLIDIDYVEWNGFPDFYICLRIFGQNWYLQLDDYYGSTLHKIDLIKL